jgi:hypothetical protein
MAVRIEEHLLNEKKQQLETMKSPKKKRKKKKQENVNWHDIMGMNNRGLKRKKGGAWGN